LTQGTYIQKCLGSAQFSVSHAHNLKLVVLPPPPPSHSEHNTHLCIVRAVRFSSFVCAFGCVNTSFQLFHLDRTDVICTLLCNKRKQQRGLLWSSRTVPKKTFATHTMCYSAACWFQEIGSLQIKNMIKNVLLTPWSLDSLSVYRVGLSYWESSFILQSISNGNECGVMWQMSWMLFFS